MIKICENFLRYLESCEALNNSSFSYDVSIPLNYWLYDKLTNIYKDNNTNEISIGFVLTCLHCHHQVEKEKAAAQARHMPQDSRQEPLSGTHGHGPGAPVTPAPPAGSDAALIQEKSGIGAKVDHSVLGAAPV
ncbi:PIR Superfamily Protein, partial [Plasmodium ovale curtisi]